MLSPKDIKPFSNKKIWWRCEKGHEYQAMVNARTGRGNGCPYCSGHKVLPGFNDLATLKPNLIKEWDYNKNTDITPSQITTGSDKKVWWVCKKGHEYQTAIYHRTGNKPTACPICANRKLLKGYNDFKTLYPDISKEWHPTLNGEFKPEDIICRASKNVWWKCSKCGYEYQKKVVQKVLYHKCPKCKS